MVLSIISLAIALVVALYCGHVAIVFQRFNDGIRDWSRELDKSTKEAIERSARLILVELDKKISEHLESNSKTCQNGKSAN